MKLSLSRKTKQLASALLTTLVICSILSMFVMYYLSLIDQQSYLSARSQVWNMAIAISEAGVEEGLQQLNANWPTLSTDGWAYDGVNNCYSKSNSLAGNNAYQVYIFVTNGVNPVVVSRAYVSSLPKYGMNSGSGFFATTGQGTTAPTTVTRAVMATCAKANLFTAALAVKTSIDLKGNGVYTDSFNSQDPNKSVNGKYASGKYSGDRGDIGTNGGITNGSVSVQNANIYGIVHTGPGAPVTVGSQGAVGTHAWQASNSGFEPGYVLPDANFTFPDTTYPNTSSWLTPTGGVLVVTSNFVSTVTNLSAQFPTNSNVGYVNTNFSTATVGTYPASPPAGLYTNFVNTTSPTLPNPIPFGIVTNTVPTNSVALPSPAPVPTTTNTTPVSLLTYPLAGTYIGAITTNVVTTGNPSGRGTWYNYNQITGYTYNVLSGYTYPVVSSYSYPVFSNYVYTLNTTYSTYQTNSYNYILAGNNSYTNYYVLNGNPSGTTYYVTGPNVVLGMQNGLTGNENITWAQGATLLIYSGGTSVAVSGNNYINPNGSAGSLIVFCAPTVTSFTLNGNGQFTGVLVAPNADVSMHGGGNSNEDFCGSLLCNSCGLNGHFSFHYDESLSNYSLNGRFLVTSWNEVK